MKSKLPVISTLQRYQSNEQSAFVQTSNTAVVDLPACFHSTPEHIKVDELQAQLAILKNENKTLEAFNDTMYQTTITSYLNSSKA